MLTEAVKCLQLRWRAGCSFWHHFDLMLYSEWARRGGGADSQGEGDCGDGTEIQHLDKMAKDALHPEERSRWNTSGLKIVHNGINLIDVRV